VAFLPSLYMDYMMTGVARTLITIQSINRIIMETECASPSYAGKDSTCKEYYNYYGND
jgi:hypothetical protein